jgi:RNA polymerase sigma-70 factor (ECF subfamily)
MTDIEVFNAERPRLFALAYRMLGSASDAEDVLQDAWLRFSRADLSDVHSPQAYAATIVTRLCLDQLKSSRARRESYPGPWLPEPLLTAQDAGPDVRVERAESVTLAFLLLLETLSAEERAVFLLKEVFDYEHSEIAGTLGISIVNSRQLFHRAKSKVRQLKTARARTHRAKREIAARFLEAFELGDPSRLTALLAEEVSFVADGGGKVPAARRPLTGRAEVLKLLVGLRRSAQATGLAAHATLQLTDVNAEPAVIVRIKGEVDSVFVLSVDTDIITGIRVVRNPEKLVFLKQQLASVM